MEETVRRLEAALPVVAKTGKILFGRNNVLWALRNEADKIKVILVARNPPPGLLEEIGPMAEERGVPLLRSRRTNLELGALCGRPHSVSVVAIYDFGSAPIEEETLYAKQ